MIVVSGIRNKVTKQGCKYLHICRYMKNNTTSIHPLLPRLLDFILQSWWNPQHNTDYSMYMYIFSFTNGTDIAKQVVFIIISIMNSVDVV